jgi:hypothetical protein
MINVNKMREAAKNAPVVSTIDERKQQIADILIAGGSGGASVRGPRVCASFSGDAQDMPCLSFDFRFEHQSGSVWHVVCSLDYGEFQEIVIRAQFQNPESIEPWPLISNALDQCKEEVKIGIRARTELLCALG